LRPWLWRALFENFSLKVLSLLVALGFYGFMHTARNTQRTIQVPIVADMPLPSVGRQLVTPIPEAINVTIEGSRQQIDSLDRLDPIPLNLRAASDDVVHFTPGMIPGLPPGVRVKRIIPESLPIRWENIVERTLDVQVPITGQLRGGLELKAAVRVTPSQITISGPESLVKGIQLARTEPFDIGGLGEGVHERTLPLTPSPPNASSSQTHVQATVEVARKMLSRELDVKVQVIGLARAKVEPAMVRVTIEGAPDRIESLRPDGIIARVEPKEANVDTSTPGNALLPVLLEIPNAKVTVDPAKVLVRW
jgi:YbbR domain-containing protein